MAVITSANTDRTLAFPGGMSAVKLNIKNDAGKAISGINILFQLYGNDLGGNADSVDCGYAIGGAGVFADLALATGKSVEISGFLEPPAEAAEAFAPGVRAAPVYLRYTVKYKDGSMFAHQSALENVYVLNRRYNPQIPAFILERAENGVPNDEGENVLVTLKLALEDPAETGFMGLTLYYAENAVPDIGSASIDLTAEIPRLLMGVSDDPGLIPDSFSNGSDWNFMLVFGDEYESAGFRLDIAKAFANLHLSGKRTGGACFGGFSSSGNGEPKLESYYEGCFYRGIRGVNIYSTEEVATGGRWIDGKPIYRRTFAGTLKKGAANESIGVLPEDYESVVSIDGVWSVGDGRFMPHNYWFSASVYTRMNVNADGEVIIYCSDSTYVGRTMYATIAYTKSSDSPFDPNAGYAYFTTIEGEYFIDANGESLMTEV